MLLSLGKMGSSFKSFGAAPLENIVKNHKHLILEDLENALSQQQPQVLGNPDAHELPPLVSEAMWGPGVSALQACFVLCFSPPDPPAIDFNKHTLYILGLGNLVRTTNRLK